MTRAASSPDVSTSKAVRGGLALAALGAAALVAAGCADAGDRGGAPPASGTGAAQQGAGVVSGAAGGAPGTTVGGGVGGSAGGAGTADGVATRPATTGGGDAGTPVTPDTASKMPPTTR